MLFFGNQVRKSVVNIIDSRIKNAQALYDNSVKILADETLVKIENIQAEQKVKKQNLLDECVHSVLNPLR